MMKRLEQLKQFLRWFWEVAKPYWISSEKFKAWGLLASIILFIIATENTYALLANYQGKLTTALASKEANQFQYFLILVGVSLLGWLFFLIVKNFVQEKLALYWRKWLTNDFLHNYFGDRAFYQINGNKEIDNPDQRISEDIDSFVNSSLQFSLDFFDTILKGFLFIAILWSINHNLVFIAILTAFIQTLVSFFIGRVLTPLNFKSIQYQADFRYSLVHVRNNSESIAFYQGEEQEAAMVRSKFSQLLEIINAKILPSSVLVGVNVALTFSVIIIAYLVLAPQYFADKIPFGDITRAIQAFGEVVSVFAWFATYFQRITLFAAVIKRLGTFRDYLQQNKQLTSSPESLIQTLVEPRFALSHLTVKTPDQKRVLVEDLSTNVPYSEGILLMGASGCGKSSILRAVAGLWNKGEGYIYRPNTEEILFIPQRPYMVIGSLRSQILYPYIDKNISDTRIQEVLEQVNLANLVERVGGLEVELNWADVLSLGEQQRLGFARLFLHNPKYAVLDESTSALDVNNEQHLYQMLRDADITYLSVGHRPTLIPFHQLVVEILGQGKWRFSSPAESTT
jgi:putative ATP-binding cassette transporter